MKLVLYFILNYNVIVHIVFCQTETSFLNTFGNVLNFVTTFGSASINSILDPDFEDVGPFVLINCYNPTTKSFSDIINIYDPELSTKLDVKKKTGFFIHGWLATYDDVWVKELFSTWTKNRDENVCRVDWSQFSKQNYVSVVIRHIRSVSHYLTSLLKSLNETYNIGYDSIILVGHSLGAHLCGLMGNELDGKIGVIIGLDPAGPLFSMPVVIPTQLRLDPTDAVFVQVIHSGDGGLGYNIDGGHQDFYINNGRIPQKGCMLPDLVQPVFEDMFQCSHYRSVQLFQDSLANKDLCIGIKCNSFLRYYLKNCKPRYDYLGLDSKRIPGKFFLSTNDTPICAGKFY